MKDLGSLIGLILLGALVTYFTFTPYKKSYITEEFHKKLNNLKINKVIL